MLGLGVELVLLGLQEGSAWGFSLPIDGEVVAGIVVVMQVFVGHGAQGLHQVGTEETTFLEALDEVRSLKQMR